MHILKKMKISLVEKEQLLNMRWRCYILIE